MENHSSVMANDELLSAARKLIERYTPDPVPPCRVCGGPLSIQSSGRSGVSYACSGNYVNEEGLIRYHEDRRLADEHYMASRWEQFQSDNEDVLRFVNAVTEILERQAAGPQSSLGWLKVPEEYSLEFLKSINSNNQVLAYENGRYYNAWMEFEPSEGGWLWTDDADSEPNPSHYRFLKEVEFNPPGKNAASAPPIIKGEETSPEGITRRLFDGSAPMADGGEHRMTAAEEVLSWLLVEKIGVPDDVAYTPDQAQEMIAERLISNAAGPHAEAEDIDPTDSALNSAAAAASVGLTIGGTRFNNDGTYEYIDETGTTSRRTASATSDAKGLVVVRLIDTEHGQRIHPDDVKKFGLKADYPYEGEALPVGRFRIAIGVEPQSATDHMHRALVEVRDAIMRANPEVLTDTLWMPEDVMKGATVVDRIDMALAPSNSNPEGNVHG